MAIGLPVVCGRELEPLISCVQYAELRRSVRGRKRLSSQPYTGENLGPRLTISPAGYQSYASALLNPGPRTANTRGSLAYNLLTLR